MRLAALAAAVAAVTSSAVLLPAAPASAACQVTVDLPNFSPATLHVAPGTTVEWCWASGNHSVTGTGFDSGVRDDGATYSHAFPTAGTYAYHCQVHDVMRASVVVDGPKPTATHTTTPPRTTPPASSPRPVTTTRPATRTTAPRTAPPATRTPSPSAARTTPPGRPATTPPEATGAPTAATTPLAGDPAGGGVPALPIALGAVVLAAAGAALALRGRTSR